MGFYYYEGEPPTDARWTRESHGLRPPYISIRRMRFGWPFRSTYYDIINTINSSDRQLLLEHLAITEERTGWRQGVSVPDRWPKDSSVYQLPVMPHAPGFAGNIAIYACVYMLLELGVRHARRRRRLKRGLCPTCCYDLTGVPSCPECGPSV